MHAFFSFFSSNVHIKTGRNYFNMECPICLDDMLNKKRFIGPCAHSWCLECHHKKLKYDHLCPLCRVSHVQGAVPDFRVNGASFFLEYYANGVYTYVRPWKIKQRQRHRFRS